MHIPREENYWNLADARFIVATTINIDKLFFTSNLISARTDVINYVANIAIYTAIALQHFCCNMLYASKIIMKSLERIYNDK